MIAQRPGAFLPWYNSGIMKARHNEGLPRFGRVVLSAITAREWLESRERGLEGAEGTLDLGVTRCFCALTPRGVVMDDGDSMSWPDLERISTSEKGCFLRKGEAWEELYGFSEEMNWAWRLVPTREAPALHLSGFTMHRQDGVGPFQGAMEMVKALGELRGDVLDTCTGLGYAAQGLARHARRVVTIERSRTVREIWSMNPWSAGLLGNPVIERLEGDCMDHLDTWEEGIFAGILHDPPSISLTGDLYSSACYRELYRLLKWGGRLFHYIGDPESALGSTTTRGVIRRLNEAGFRKISPRPRAFGILAFKEDRFHASGREQRGRKRI